MNEFAGTLRIYRVLLGARARAQFQYRFSFAMEVLGNAALTVVDFLEIAVIFHQVPQLRSWTLWEVAFLYGTAGLSLAITDLVIGTLDQLPNYIRAGTFDQFLIRPLGTLFQTATADFGIRQIGRMGQALVVLIVSLQHVHVSWTVGRIVMLPVMIVAACVIFGAIWVVGASVTFWSVNTMETTNAFTYGGGFLSSYPLNIYGVWLRRLVLFAIPLGFVNYFPALYMLDRVDPLHLPSLLRFSSPIVAIVAALVASAVWRFAVRHYRSTGS